MAKEVNNMTTIVDIWDHPILRLDVASWEEAMDEGKKFFENGPGDDLSFTEDFTQILVINTGSGFRLIATTEADLPLLAAELQDDVCGHWTAESFREQEVTAS